jgi:hypothetical protein
MKNNKGKNDFSRLPRKVDRLCQAMSSLATATINDNANWFKEGVEEE